MASCEGPLRSEYLPNQGGSRSSLQTVGRLMPPLSMFLFTDGSQLNDGSTGAGWYGHWGAWKQESTCDHLALPRHEVFDAEAVATYEG
ncbi:hypothetical protein SI65_07302 [Aspergillus cristatus]|uniref:Uncharacterized protein n=1 Tax=Aspergillus cristatus TaxID=573508 RepID=A0A1E3B9K4_ASPCR|nr:hypothetical protein SI65_07302 [Aspergillus cristatus]